MRGTWYTCAPIPEQRPPLLHTTTHKRLVCLAACCELAAWAESDPTGGGHLLRTRNGARARAKGQGGQVSFLPSPFGPRSGAPCFFFFGLCFFAVVGRPFFQLPLPDRDRARRCE